MKISPFFCGVFALCLFAACKKDDSTTVPEVSKPDPLTLLKDSCSFEIDGNLYSFNSRGKWGWSNGQVNARLDSTVKGVEYYSGDKDSVMIGVMYGLSGYYNSNKYGNIEITFLKKYRKDEANKNWTNSLIYRNKEDLFQLGNYKFSSDYQRENTQNGIAISMNIGGTFSTFSEYPLRRPTTITSASHLNSKFEIIRSVKLSNGAYLLEAKFNTTVFDGDEKIKKNVKNGYLRYIIY
jgi:hypothetical protein